VGDNGNNDNGEEQNNQDSDGNERIQCSQLPEAPDSKDTLIINTISSLVIVLAHLFSTMSKVVTVSVHEEKRNTTIECHPIMFYSSVASNITYL